MAKETDQAVGQASARGDGSQHPCESKESQGGLWTSSFILICFVNLFVFMGFNMTNTGIPVFVDTLGGSTFEVGLVSTLATGAALVTRPFTGMMVDRFGRKGILVAGLVVTVLSIAMFLVFPIVSVILMIRLIQGIGWGFSSTATSTIVADILPKPRFAEGMGYFSMTTSLATAIAPALSIVLLENAGSEVMLWVTLAFMAVALVVAIAGRFENPAQIKAERPGAPKDEPRRIRLADLFDRRALLPSVLTCLLTMAFAPIGTFIVLHAQGQGVEGIALYFVVYAIVNFATRPVLGKLIDKVGFFWPSIVAALGVMLTLGLIAWGQSLFVFCLAGAFAGLGFGTSMSAFQTMAVAAVKPERRGVATSTYLVGLNGGMALGALVAGALAGLLGYAGMYTATILLPVIVLVAVFVIGPKRMEAYRPNTER